MMRFDNGSSDGLVDRLREKRSAPAVLKEKLARIRSQRTRTFVFAIEGAEDKDVYYHWFKQVAPMLDYEVIVCNGKGGVLDFRSLLQRDKDNLKDRVFFLVDHDFDGLRGQPAGSDVYVTDTYSVENHLVNSWVLDDLLKIALQCDGEPACRMTVIHRFDALYEKFLGITKDHNLRIFVAKKVGIRNLKPLPKRINPLVKVALDDVIPSYQSLVEVIPLEREPTEDEIKSVVHDFQALEPSLQYRGKFALAFFMRFLELVAEDRGSDNPVLFRGLAPKAANGKLSLDAISSKSVAPQPFKDFVTSVISKVAAAAVARDHCSTSFGT